MIREIYVVDDNVDYQFIFFKLLKELNLPYAVKFFENGRACHKHIKILLAKDVKNIPALVVLDLNMPGMNGLQLLQMLKSPSTDSNCSLEDVPVVIMSHYISEHQIRQCYQAGANAVLQKPTDYKSLKMTVESVCRFWLERNHYEAIANHHGQQHYTQPIGNSEG